MHRRGARGVRSARRGDSVSHAGSPSAISRDEYSASAARSWRGSASPSVSWRRDLSGRRRRGGRGRFAFGWTRRSEHVSFPSSWGLQPRRFPLFANGSWEACSLCLGWAAKAPPLRRTGDVFPLLREINDLPPGKFPPAPGAWIKVWRCVYIYDINMLYFSALRFRLDFLRSAPAWNPRLGRAARGRLEEWVPDSDSPFLRGPRGAPHEEGRGNLSANPSGGIR